MRITQHTKSPFNSIPKWPPIWFSHDCDITWKRFIYCHAEVVSRDFVTLMQPLCMIGCQLTADSSMHRSTRNCSICITCIAERSKQFIHDNFYNLNFSHNVARKKCHWKNVHYIEFVQVSSWSKSRVAVVYAFPIAFLSFEPHCD